MKKLWFSICMTGCLLLGLTGCLNEEEQAKLDQLIDKNVALVKELDIAYEKHKEGKLTTKELAQLTTSIKDNIGETKDEIKRMKEDGVGWMEVVGATALGLISRGIPSKGPLGQVFGMLTARRKED